MGIRVGTLAKRYEDGIGHHVCYSAMFHAEVDNSDNHLDLDVCIAMVIDVDEVHYWPNTRNPRVTVFWVQICKYHAKHRVPSQEVVDPDTLWEIGQLL